MANIHQNLATGKWQQLSLIEQLANIGSEIGRVEYWQKAGDNQNQTLAVRRAIELLDLTIADRRWLSRLTELTRLREVFCDLFIGKNNYNTSFKLLKDYFLWFALAARK